MKDQKNPAKDKGLLIYRIRLKGCFRTLQFVRENFHYVINTK